MRDGFQGTKLGKVARDLGMSRDIIHHYFKDKNELLEAVIRLSYRRISKAIIDGLRKAISPMEQLVAIVEGYFFSDCKKFWRTGFN